MLNTKKINNLIEENVEEYWADAKKEIEETLKSDGYSHIFENVEVNFTNEGFSINATFKEGIKTEDQDVFELLARGGALEKKDGSFIKVKPSSVLIKYLSKR